MNEATKIEWKEEKLKALKLPRKVFQCPLTYTHWCTIGTCIYVGRVMNEEDVI